MILCILLVLAAGVCITGALVWRTYKTSLASLEDEAVRQAHSLAYEAEPSLLLGDRKELQRMVRSLATDSAVTNVRIHDSRGTPLATFCRTHRDNPLDCSCEFPLETKPNLEMSPILKLTPTQLFVTTPVWRGDEGIELDLSDAEGSTTESGDALPIGTVSLTHRLDGLHEQTKSHIAYSILVVVLVIACGAGITVLAVRKLLLPVQNLVDTTTLIAQGDLSRRASENAAGEIGVLARSFNRMAQALGENMDGLENQVRDRTGELTRSAAALAEKERHLRTLLESQPDCVKTIDRDGRFLSMNAAGLAILGVDSADEIRATSVFDFICAPHWAAFKDLMRTVFEGETGTLQFEIQPRSGERRWVETHAAPLHDAHGAVAAYLAVTRDVTDTKRRVAELREAKDRAEAGDKTKSEFLANISHEIRTPMNGIIGMTQLALDSDLNEEQRSNLETVLKCAESLLGLLSDILDFSKIGAGKLDIELTELDIKSCVGSALDVVGATARERSLSLTHQVSDDFPDDLLGDPHRLRQVLINLVSNAVKFTERGSVLISADVESVTDASATVLLCVKDTGIGIPQDRLNAIFDSFTQADGATTRKYGGTGLGLAISKQIVELMGGKIWVESTPGRGSSFFLRLELRRRGRIGGVPTGVQSAAEHTDAERILNVEAALERLLGDRELLLEAIGAFTESLPSAIRKIRGAIAGQDVEALQAAARDLQGAASNVGAEAIERAACDLEGMADNPDGDAIRDAFERLERGAGRLSVEAQDIAFA